MVCADNFRRLGNGCEADTCYSSTEPFTAFYDVNLLIKAAFGTCVSDCGWDMFIIVELVVEFPRSMLSKLWGLKWETGMDRTHSSQQQLARVPTLDQSWWLQATWRAVVSLCALMWAILWFFFTLVPVSLKYENLFLFWVVQKPTFFQGQTFQKQLFQDHINFWYHFAAENCKYDDMKETVLLSTDFLAWEQNTFYDCMPHPRCQWEGEKFWFFDDDACVHH